MSRNPVKTLGFTRKTLPNYEDDSVISEVLARAKADSYRNYIILLTLWRTGMRVSDIVSFKKRDISNNSIIIRGGKGGLDRVIPLDPELGTILGLFLDKSNPKDRVFDITQRQVRNIVYKYSPPDHKLHPHTFRHSFAVHCLKGGMNLRSLQKILGHSSLTTTQIYLDITGLDIKEDFAKVKW